MQNQNREDPKDILGWHAGLLHKIKSCFLPDLYAIIKSYILQRIFRVKFGKVITQLKDINSGVPSRQRAGTEYLVLIWLYSINYFNLVSNVW